jgi:Flp pilus assembly protein TadD
LPALVTLGAPVLLDVPGIGAVSVPEETYTSLYPMFSSDDEAVREQAYRQLQEQVERQPESLIHVPAATRSASSYSRGLAALDRGEFDAAIAEFTTAMGDDPKDTFAYLTRATAYEKKGDSASAISDYRNALKLVDREDRADINATIRRLGGKP